MAKEKRAWLYSLHALVEGKWVRVASLETTLSSARKIWRSALIAPHFNAVLPPTRLMPTRQSANSYRPGER